MEPTPLRLLTAKQQSRNVEQAIRRNGVDPILVILFYGIDIS